MKGNLIRLGSYSCTLFVLIYPKNPFGNFICVAPPASSEHAQAT